MPGLAPLQPSQEALSTIRPGIVHRLDKGTTGRAQALKSCELRPSGERISPSAAQLLGVLRCAVLRWAVLCGWPLFEARPRQRGQARDEVLHCDAGLLVVAKDAESLWKLADQFKAHTVRALIP